MRAAEVVLKEEGKDEAWEQRFCVQAVGATLAQMRGRLWQGARWWTWQTAPGDAGPSASLMAAPPCAPLQEELFQSHLQLERWGCRSSTLDQAAKRSLEVLVQVLGVLCVPCMPRAPHVSANPLSAPLVVVAQDNCHH